MGFDFGSPDRKHAMLTTGDKTISALFRSQRGTLLRCNVRNISLVNVSERICKIEKGIVAEVLGDRGENNELRCPFRRWHIHLCTP